MDKSQSSQEEFTEPLNSAMVAVAEDPDPDAASSMPAPTPGPVSPVASDSASSAVALRQLSPAVSSFLAPALTWADRCQYQCAQCSQDFTSYASLKNHAHQEHGRSADAPPGRRTVTSTLECQICFKHVICDSYFLAKHFDRHDHLSLLSYGQKYPDSLASELRPEPAPRKSSDAPSWADQCEYECGLCSTTLPSYLSLRDHALKEHGLSMSEMTSRYGRRRRVWKYLVCQLCEEKVICDSLFVKKHMADRHRGLSLAKYADIFPGDLLGEDIFQEERRLKRLDLKREGVTKIGASVAPEGKFICRRCGRVFDCMFRMSLHAYSRHKRSVRAIFDPRQHNSRRPRHACHLCPTVLPGKVSRIACHLKIAHDNMSKEQYWKQYSRRGRMAGRAGESRVVSGKLIRSKWPLARAQSEQVRRGSKKRRFGQREVEQAEVNIAGLERCGVLSHWSGQKKCKFCGKRMSPCRSGYSYLAHWRLYHRSSGLNLNEFLRGQQLASFTVISTAGTTRDVRLKIVGQSSLASRRKREAVKAVAEKDRQSKHELSESRATEASAVLVGRKKESEKDKEVPKISVSVGQRQEMNNTNSCHDLSGDSHRPNAKFLKGLLKANSTIFVGDLCYDLLFRLHNPMTKTLSLLLPPTNPWQPVAWMNQCRYECKDCWLTVSSFASFVLHAEQMHTSVFDLLVVKGHGHCQTLCVRLDCQLCGESVICDQLALVQHMRDFHASLPLAEYAKRFPSHLRGVVASDARVLNSNFLFSCEECLSRFDSPDELRLHVQTMHYLRHFDHFWCLTCHRFCKRDSLDSHIINKHMDMGYESSLSSIRVVGKSTVARILGPRGDIFGLVRSAKAATCLLCQEKFAFSRKKDLWDHVEKRHVMGMDDAAKLIKTMMAARTIISESSRKISQVTDKSESDGKELPSLPAFQKPSVSVAVVPKSSNGGKELPPLQVLRKQSALVSVVPKNSNGGKEFSPLQALRKENVTGSVSPEDSNGGKELPALQAFPKAIVSVGVASQSLNGKKELPSHEAFRKEIVSPSPSLNVKKELPSHEAFPKETVSVDVSQSSNSEKEPMSLRAYRKSGLSVNLVSQSSNAQDAAVASTTLRRAVPLVQVYRATEDAVGHLVRNHPGPSSALQTQAKNTMLPVVQVKRPEVSEYFSLF